MTFTRVKKSRDVMRNRSRGLERQQTREAQRPGETGHGGSHLRATFIMTLFRKPLACGKRSPVKHTGPATLTHRILTPRTRPGHVWPGVA